MKKFVSVNGKYYKHSNAKGEFGHVNRLFKDNKNSFPEFTKNNFGSSGSSIERYNKIHAKHAAAIGKKVRKDANTFLDCIVAFSLEQWEYIESKKTPEEMNKAMSKMTVDFMREVRDTMGYEPISYEYHLDEGHVKSSLKRNVHAHVQFYNYDFYAKKAPLRSMKKNDFSVFQDIAAKAFKHGGFERGLSKEITQKKHLKKDDFIAAKHKELDKDIIIKQTKLDTLKDSIKSLYNEFSTNISKFVENILKQRQDRFFDDIIDVQNTINNTENDNVSDLMTEHSNKTAQQLNVPHSFSRRKGRKRKSKFDS